VLAALADAPVPVRMLAVRKLPRSGRPAELLDYAQISRKHIASNVKNMLSVS
jgi:transketolase